MELYDLMPYFLLTISLCFIGMALFTYLKKKPLIFDSRWNLTLIIACFSPSLIGNIQRIIKEPKFDFMDLFPLLMIAILIVWFVFMMKGYIVFGADATELQKSFLQSVEDKKYQYEQSMSAIKIINPELEIAVSIQSWVGSAQFRPKTTVNQEVLKDIITQLKTKDIKANYITPLYYASIGIIMTILSLYLILNPIGDI